MANTSAIFKGSRTKLLTKDGLSLEAGQNMKQVDSAGAGKVYTSDAAGVGGWAEIAASQVTSGTFDIARIPQAAMERLTYVADEAARFLLTTATVQNGDSVFQNDTSLMYIVIDDSKLDQAAGYQVYN